MRSAWTPTLPRLGAVLFVSGFCSLVYQVAWLRMLRLVFGSSTASTAVVLAIFMGGLGLGGLVFGRRAERAANPLRLYAALELGIAVFAALSPLLVALAQATYLGLGGSAVLGQWGATPLRLGLAALVLGVPTTLMGGTLPAVAQAMERSADAGRRIVAHLYGVNTVGAVLGAFLTTFVLVEALGVRRSLWLAAFLNALLSAVVLAFSRQVAAKAPRAAATAPEPMLPDTKPAGFPTTVLGRASTRQVLAAAFVVGFVFFLMELVWYRMLAPILGGSSYTFGLILVVALAGIGCGGWLYAVGRKERRPSLGALALTCALEAVFLAVPWALGDDLAFFAWLVRDLGASGFAALVAGWTLVTAAVVLPTALVAGYQFPLLVALLGAGRRHVGSEVGLAYAWNTFGAILGALAGGFVLLPLLGAPLLWRASALALIALSALLTLGPRRRWWAPLGGLWVLAAVALAADGPSAFWRHTAIGAGRAEFEAGGPNALRRERLDARRSLVREAEGVESSVALLAKTELSLFVNGKSDGSARGDAPMQVMSGMVGALLHPEPRRVLVIGLGTGMTAGWLAQVDTVETVDVVELEPAVVDFAADYAPLTFDVLSLPNVHLRVGDGRELVRTTRERYDVIFSEPSNPYRAGVADLFSRDFYRAVHDRLAPGGIFIHWLQGYETDAGVVRIAYSTLGSVFGHIESWQVDSADLLLIAGRDPIPHDVERLRRRVAREPFRSALRLIWRVEGLEGLYSAFVANPELARRLAGGPVSTDDRPIIEFGFARNVGRTGLFRVEDLQTLSLQAGTHRPEIAVTGPGAVDWQRVAELRQVRHTIDAFTEQPPERLEPGERSRREAREAYREGDLEAAGRLWLSQAEGPSNPLDHLLVAEALAEAGDLGFESAQAELAAEAPTEWRLLRARYFFRTGEIPAAVDELERGFMALRDDGWAFRPVVQRSLNLAPRLAAAAPAMARRLFDALGEPFAVRLFEELRRIRRFEVALRGPFTELCVEALAPYEPHVFWEERFLDLRRECYARNDHPRAAAAARELERYRSRKPPELEIDR